MGQNLGSKGPKVVIVHYFNLYGTIFWRVENFDPYQSLDGSPLCLHCEPKPHLANEFKVPSPETHCKPEPTIGN